MRELKSSPSASTCVRLQSTLKSKSITILMSSRSSETTGVVWACAGFSRVLSFAVPITPKTSSVRQRPRSEFFDTECRCVANKVLLPVQGSDVRRRDRSRRWYMLGKNTAVFGIYPTYESLEGAVDALRSSGFRNTDVSFLMAENVGSKDL